MEDLRDLDNAKCSSFVNTALLGHEPMPNRAVNADSPGADSLAPPRPIFTLGTHSYLASMKTHHPVGVVCLAGYTATRSHARALYPMRSQANGGECPGYAFTCDRHCCSQMASCAEAYFSKTARDKMDGNHDGVPCETIVQVGPCGVGQDGLGRRAAKQAQCGRASAALRPPLAPVACLAVCPQSRDNVPTVHKEARTCC
jgi:hypothetical protein